MWTRQQSGDCPQKVLDPVAGGCAKSKVSKFSDQPARDLCVKDISNSNSTQQEV